MIYCRFSELDDWEKLVAKLATQLSWVNTVPAQKQGRKLSQPNSTSTGVGARHDNG
jgi:hypothetical protein